MKLSTKAQDAMNAVITKFESGDLSPLIHVARIQRDPNDTMPSSKWTFANQVLVYVQTGTLDCRGFKQWKSVGRHPTKGTHGAWILAPNKITKENDAGEKESFTVGFRGICVHPVTNTDGDPLPEFDYTPAELPPLANVAARMGISVEYTPTPPDRLGDCNGKGTHINVGTHNWRTWFHELAHAAHARIDGGLHKSNEAMQETVAEFTACILMNLYGYDYSGKAWDYISRFAKDPLRAIMRATAKVGQILELLEVM